MSSSPPSIFLDANVLVYLIDETAQQHNQVVTKLQELVDGGSTLYTSHHVVEEVLFIVSKLASNKNDVTEAIRQISAVPNLFLIEPETNFEFAKRYIKLWRNLNLGINDALITQLMLDGGLKHLFSFDLPLLKRVKKAGILSVL